MKTETKEITLITATPDDGKRFVNKAEKVVADKRLYLPTEDAISAWEEMDEADALALKAQWEKEAEEAAKKEAEASDDVGAEPVVADETALDSQCVKE